MPKKINAIIHFGYITYVFSLQNKFFSRKFFTFYLGKVLELKRRMGLAGLKSLFHSYAIFLVIYADLGKIVNVTNIGPIIYVRLTFFR